MENNAYILLKKIHGNYLPGVSKDNTLSTLAWMFEEGLRFLKRMKEEIFSENTTAEYTSNATRLRRSHDIVSIEPLYGDDAEEYRVELSRDALLKLINDWQVLVAQEPDEIIMTRAEHGVITLEGVFKQRTS